MHMDHHCPFLATCVGEGSLRAFLVFVGWAALGTAYAGAVGGVALWRRWHEVSPYRVWRRLPTMAMAYEMVYRKRYAAPLWTTAMLRDVTEGRYVRVAARAFSYVSDRLLAYIMVSRRPFVGRLSSRQSFGSIPNRTRER